MFLEGCLDVMENIKNMVLLGSDTFVSKPHEIETELRIPPWAKARREIENAILTDQRMEDIRHKLGHRRVLRIIYRKHQLKLQDRISIVA